jgi:hypothetical protein
MRRRVLLDPASSRRLLQATVAVLSLVPIAAGTAGVVLGPGFVGGVAGPTDLDSHFRYLSGIFLGLGLVFASTVPAIERRTARFRLASGLVVCGGVGRLLSLLTAGAPAWPHLAGLFLELVVVPLLVLWQGSVAATVSAADGAGPVQTNVVPAYQGSSSRPGST